MLYCTFLRRTCCALSTASFTVSRKWPTANFPSARTSPMMSIVALSLSLACTNGICEPGITSETAR